MPYTDGKELRCDECDHLVDRHGDTIDPAHCSECVSHSPNPPCEVCGFMSCDQSC